MPLRSNVVRRSSISSEECTSAGRESFTSSYRRYPRSLPTAISWRTASYFSSKPVAATALLPLPKCVSRFPRELHRCSSAHCPHEMQRESPRWTKGGSESPGRLSIFSVKLDAPVLCPLCCCTLARLPCRCRTVPSTIDIRIDAGTDQSVIRATLLRYTLKSLPVNILVCGKLVQKVEDFAAHSTLNSIPDKGFSRSLRSFWPSRSRTFHSWATVGASGNGLEGLRLSRSDHRGFAESDNPLGPN